MKERTFGHKKGEGINFHRLSEEHQLHDMDADELVKMANELAAKLKAKKDGKNEGDDEALKEAA